MAKTSSPVRTPRSENGIHSTISRPDFPSAEGKSGRLIVEWMPFSERGVLTGLLVFAIGVVVGIGIGSASAVAALTQGAPDVLQTWSGVVALP